MTKLRNFILAGALSLAFLPQAEAGSLYEFREFFSADALNALLDRKDVESAADGDPDKYPTYEILGATVMVGIKKADGSLKKKWVYDIQIPEDFNDSQAYVLKRQGRRPTPARGERMDPAYEDETGDTQFAFPIPLSGCGQAGNGPVISMGSEGPYIINWCVGSGTSPRNALKNYFYVFANGDTMNILTMKYQCTSSGDRNSMPENVLEDACLS